MTTGTPSVTPPAQMQHSSKPPQPTEGSKAIPNLATTTPSRSSSTAHYAPFRSLVRYNPERMHVAAVYCSDGRVGEHFDDFLQNGLGLPRYDRVALPGGPACLAGYDEAKVEQVGIVDELKFLIDAHALTRVVLIQHQLCAFYSKRLRVRENQMEHLQYADLVRAAYFIRHVTSLEHIDAFFARRNGDAIEFEAVSLE